MTNLADVRIETDGDIVLARIDGELDLSNTPTVARELIDGVANEAIGVVLDLSEVAYLDSTGVQMLFELAERLVGRQQQLVLAVPDDSPLQRVLQIASLGDTVPIVADRGSAEAQLR